MPNRKEVLYQDFSARMQPRLLWDSPHYGTAVAVHDRERRTVYKPKPYVAKKSGARKLTEAEDNALGRAHRRRQNRHARGWKPFAQR